MSNAARYRKKAAEFEQLKQVDRAIASYIQAIEHGEIEGEDIDVALFNKVGDLTLRQGRVADAVTYYERAVEHYATAGLFNNAIALCNKILRSAPGRANVYFSLGRICAKKGLRGDATRNFLEYATRMQQDGRLEEGMRALAEVADLMPELVEVRRLVEEHAVRAGITLPQRKTPVASPVVAPDEVGAWKSDKSSTLVFLDTGDPVARARHTPSSSTPTARPATPRRSKVTMVNDLPFIEIPLTPASAQAAIDSPDARAPIATPDTTAPVPEVFTASAIESVVDGPVDVPTDVEVESLLSDADVRATPVPDKTDEKVIPIEDAPTVSRLDALESFELEVSDEPVVPMEGLTTDEVETDRIAQAEDVVPNLTWLVPADANDNVAGQAGLMPTDEGSDGDDLALDSIRGLQTEDVEHIGDAASAIGTVGATAGQPPVGATEARMFTPLENSPVPELEAAIAAGALAIERANAETVPPLQRPPFRLDPHDFILPGELPPLMVSDSLVNRGLESALQSSGNTGWNASSDADEPTEIEHVVAAQDAALDAPTDEDTDLVFIDIDDESDAEVEFPAKLSASPPPTDDGESVAPALGEPIVDGVTDLEITPDTVEAETIERTEYAVRSTPSLPTAAVAVEANAVAAARREELMAAVAAAPHDWGRRRRLAEAMFEVGEREAGLAELQAALSGYAQSGALATAADIADELVTISPERIPYHQKRVELAVRLNDQNRLGLAYLDLADTLIRTGDDVRAHAVFARVLEIDPYDQRARAALGAAAPPPPPPPRTDDDYVDLAQWLKDDAPISTRMRMQEPTVTGDEQADFDALLRHFKDGVARSVGEEDYESRYDLGVAYKEMGLLDDAITEFQKALRSAKHRLPAYEALGQCFVEQERHSVAVTVLTRALHEPGLDDQHLIGVIYLLAYSCEALQRWEEARSYYSRVYATDTSFRDAAARLAGLDKIAL